MNIPYAVLLDTVSIQKYIFQSNKLKENIGASFLVRQIYQEYLDDAVLKIFGNNFDTELWQKEPSVVHIHSEPFEVGYIGGGNALLFFQEEEMAKKFVKQWTKSLLTNAPGILTSVAMDKFDLDKFQESKINLFNQLRYNKSKYVPETLIPRHGFTAECTHSGLSMDVYNAVKDEYVSASSNAKIDAAQQALDYIQNKYKDILKERFSFTNELDKLGGINEEDSHIAIVHLDGNDMASRFKAMDSLEKIRNLSKSVKDATEIAFSDLLASIVNKSSEIMDSLGFDKSSSNEKYKYPRDNKGNFYLPIRPIVLGGDDITFVCDGKLGIYFAKLFIEAFEKQAVSDNKKLTACAGVAIIKSKYPFYRGYQLAEALCNNAKQKRRKNNDDYSYLDFHISMGGLAGSLEEIRNKYFNVYRGNLIYRPYKFISDDEYSFDRFVDRTVELKELFSGNKIYELRQMLTLSEESAREFVQEMNYRAMKLPEIPGRNYQENLFDNKKTPYFDMIELIKFYPGFELNSKEAANENISA